MKFLVSVLTGILETETEKLKEIFKVSEPFLVTKLIIYLIPEFHLQAVSEDPKLKIFRDSLQLFMNHFLLKQTKSTDLGSEITILVTKFQGLNRCNF